MSYVDAGYVIVLVSLVLYSLSLLARRRRLERAVSRWDAGARGADTAHVPTAPDEHERP